MQKNRGFSLIEMLVVITILGIALGMSIGFLRSDRLAVNQAATGLSAQVNRARLEAIRQNCFVGIDLSTAESGNYQVAGGTGDNCTATVFQTVTFGSGDLGQVRLSSSTLPGFRFDPRGMPDGVVVGTITLSNRSGTYTTRVCVNGQGRARVSATCP